MHQGLCGNRKLVILASLFLLITPSLVLSQTTTGSILGTVTDQSGRAVPDVGIKVTNQATGAVRNVTSSTEGLYNVPQLPAGSYSVDGTVQGFSPVQVKNAVVAVGSDTRVDLRLAVGQVTQSVTVTDAVAVVETTSSEVAQVMTEDLIKSIPLNARDVQQLAVIQPGVQWMNSDYGGRAMTVAGDRPSNNRFLQEGMDLTTTYKTSPVSLASGIMLGAEAVREFKVMTTNFTAEFGEQSGGTVNILFKSGTNQVHGSAYEYYRNSIFDARNFFDLAPGQTSPPPFKRNQFGGSLGGPIRKDKTFFFLNFEGYRSDLSLSDVANVPDDDARLGKLPTGTVTVSPDVYSIFFGGANPLYPHCNTTESAGVGLCRYYSSPVESISENYYLAKIDHTFNEKNNMSLSYNLDKSSKFSPSAIGVTADDRLASRNTFTLRDTHIISPAMINSAHIGLNRTYYNDEKVTLNADFAPGTDRIDPRLFPYKLSVPCAAVCSPLSANFPSGVATPLPVISFNFGMTQFAGSATDFNFAPRWIGYTSGMLGDDVNYTHGKHSIQFGAQVKRWYDNMAQYRGNPLGAYTFSTLQQFLSGGPALTFNQDLITLPTSSYGRSWRQQLFGLYVQDTYRMRPNLTFTYGLRWEYVPGPTEKYGRTGNLNNPTPETAKAPNVGAGYFETSKRNFAPRFGVNWDPFGRGKTSIRAGAGLFFNEIEDNTYFTVGTAQYPFVTTISLTSTTPTGGMTVPFKRSVFDAAVSSGLTAPNTGGGFGMNPKTPTKYSFNFMVQQELPNHMSILVGYVGAQQRHQGRSIEWQQFYPTALAVPGQLPQFNGASIAGAAINPNCTTPGQITCYYWAGTGTSNANITGGSPYATNCTSTITRNCFVNPNFGNSITGVVFDANSSYNSLQMSLERHVGEGLFARFNYTYASCMEDSNDDLPGSDSNGGGAVWNLTRDHRANRHQCAFGGTNAGNLTLNYIVPFGKMTTSRLLKSIIGDWQINSLTSISSGVPFDVRLGYNNSRASTSGNGSDHPDVAAGCTADNMINPHNSTNYVKLSCLAPPTPGYTGNMAPLMLLAPATWTTDVGLKKDITLHESMKVQLTADMFNTFNRTNLGIPLTTTAFINATTPNTSSGQILKTIGTSRQFQIGARFTF